MRSLQPYRLLTCLAASLALLGAGCSKPTVKRAHTSIEFEPASLDFGSLPVSTEKTLQLKISNPGPGDLSILKSSLQDDARSAFQFAALPPTVPAGKSVSVDVTYHAPPSEGPDGARLVIESDADNAPEAAVSISGRAITPCADGLSLCGTDCLNLTIDDAHCGGCDTACTSPEHCHDGGCSCIPKVCDNTGNLVSCGDQDDGCGGTLHCGPCAAPNECVTNHCVPPTCTDTRINGSETDTDCGGGACPTCHLNQHCTEAARDCDPGLICSSGVCSACQQNSDCPSGQACLNGRCGPCTTAADCGSNSACVTGQCKHCPDEAAFNECGVCGGVPVSSVGAPCTNASGCASTYACNTAGNGVTCQPSTENECGVCGGPHVAGLGVPCTAASGCASQTVCNATNDGAVCAEIVQNACGVCGGPTITGVGAPCIDSGGCNSTFACNLAGTAVVCATVPRNACGICGGPTVTGVGDACTTPSGCTSSQVCNLAGTGVVCAPLTKNECGVCGGPSVSGVGANCIDSSGCISNYACNTQGTGVTCTPVGKNACGLCGGPAVSGLGVPCTDVSGCPSVTSCTLDQTQATCPAVGRNACGLCGGAPVTGVGDPCTDGEGCASHLVCNTAGTGTTCQQIGKNECGLCNGPAVPGLGDACASSSSGCTSTLVCNGSGTAAVCADVPRNACGVCGGATVTGVGDACTDPNSGCASTLACNGTGDGTVCTSVAKNGCGICGAATPANLGQSCTNGPCSGTYVCDSSGLGTVCNAPSTCSIANHVVISQIAGYIASATDEYIELYNPTANAISLNGYSLWYASAAGTSWNIELVDLSGKSIAPHGYFLATYDTASFTGGAVPPATPLLPDITYGNSTANGGHAHISQSDGQVLLWKGGSAPPSGAIDLTNPGNVDMVGYGTAVRHEGADAAVACAQGKAIIRKANQASTPSTMVPSFPDGGGGGGSDANMGNGFDTDYNFSDFVRINTPIPHNSSSPAAP